MMPNIWFMVWMFGAGATAIAMTDPSDPVGLRDLFAKYPSIRPSFKMGSAILAYYVTALLWPVIVALSIARSVR